MSGGRALVFITDGWLLDARRRLEFLMQAVNIRFVFDDYSPLPDTKQGEQNQGGGQETVHARDEKIVISLAVFSMS
jgi:hypothetical protein